MRILVTGAKGMVGSAVQDVFADHELILTDIETMDVRDYDTVMAFGERDPELIIHLAAETNLEVCKLNPKSAYLTNHTGTVHMMLLAKKLRVPIVYISTAGVFDGTRDSYTEWDAPCAINHYGRSKWFGEIALSSYDKVWIFRAGWMMGGGPDIDKKFVNAIYKKIKAGEKKIYAITDLFGSPTYTYDLAKTIRNVIEKKAKYRIYNSGGKGVASRFDVAQAIVECLKADVVIIPVKDGYFDKDFHCKRSKSEVLNNVMLQARRLSKMRHWREGLEEYLCKSFMR